MSAYLQATAAAYLIVVGFWVNVPNKRSAAIFKFPAIVLGALLGVTAYAQFMGWPV